MTDDNKPHEWSDHFRIVDLDLIDQPVGIAAFDGIIFAEFNKKEKTINIDISHLAKNNWKVSLFSVTSPL